ncbi:CubicO group peptidase (beta-lactamase class C family) [Stakelama sediminis]|uniref:CubicO group peptidase (Beta-lactamase class C family) n=1 Tax=Stakelama sediminis TaxID=463200 RepID=A0A840YUW7_9SPHN|nr:CubicO group peptidase (beta-lactamase class C family) [Stakelama sediminis]
MAKLFFLLLLLTLSVTAADARAETPDRAIQAFIGSEMPASGAPGLAYAIVDDGRITVRAYGHVVKGGERKVAPDTPFLLGSISKSFTAVAVLQLVEAGRVGLDTEIGQYLHQFADRPSGRITVRQLLSHTSGFSTVQGNAGHQDDSRTTDTLKQRVDRIAQWVPATTPGTRWEYSNANYLILGRLVEVVSGEGYARYVEDHILKPIGMTDSFVSDGRVHAGMARGHEPWFVTKRALPRHATVQAMAPAGGVVASAGDVARYLAVLMNGRDDILSAKIKAAMFRPATVQSPYYGFGWFLDPQDGTVFHTGTSPGVETLAVMIPARKKGVVVLVNASSGIGFGETLPLRNGIAVRALGLPIPQPDGRWFQKFLFVAMALLPVIFVACMVWAWFHRRELRAKSGAFGRFSLWFPLIITLGMTVLFYWYFDRFFGVSLATLRLYQPDFAMVLEASAMTGVLWAALRLVLAYGDIRGRSDR